jgi:hypothetical protein
MAVSKHWLWGAVGIGTTIVLWLFQATAQVQVGQEFQPNEAVDSIRVELVVGEEGEDLDEPIALDLGLGFPLWLHRLGRVDRVAAPFGAVSQVGTEVHAIRAGERATFEFRTAGVAGLDEMLETRQLLAGVRVSDINRVGFTSQANHGWVLSGYTIHINGKQFIANNAVNANGRGRQDEARERLMELNREASPQQVELTDLRALVAAGLATDADRTRLTELERTVSPQQAEVQRLERQLRGAAPFYVESGFRSPWRTNGAIDKVKVTVVTAPHTAASTRNYVYFRTGGHKYLLGSAVQPLAPDYGPQEFTLDLATAPLTASDLRGYALGVLAPREPTGDAPDRWHPQRLRVEVDGRLVYDSEDNDLDRASLSAIRLIPPAQLNAGGQVVANTPVAREAFVWEAGSGAGLDLVHGGAEPLPAEGDAGYPAPEPGLVLDANVNVVVQDQDNWYDPAAEPFPGEMCFGPEWEPGWAPGGGWLPDWGPGWDDGWGPGWNPGPSWQDLLLLGLLDQLGVLPDWVIPDPVGEPPQLEQVNVDMTTQTIHWTVTGDQSQVDHFTVDRVLIRPDQVVPIVETIGDPFIVPAGQCSLPISELDDFAPMWMGDLATRYYLAYRVTMVPTDPAIGVDPGLSPAIPARPMSPLTHFEVLPTYTYDPVIGPSQNRALALGGEPELPGPAAWVAGETAAHNGVVFAGLSPLQHHLVARAENNGDRTIIRVSGMIPPGHHRFIAYAGFQGAVEQHAAANITGHFSLHAGGDPPVELSADAAIEANPALAPTPLVPLIRDIDTAVIGPGVIFFHAEFTFDHPDIDPNHPPVLFGLRLLPL